MELEKVPLTLGFVMPNTIERVVKAEVVYDLLPNLTYKFIFPNYPQEDFEVTFNSTRSVSIQAFHLQDLAYQLLNRGAFNVYANRRTFYFVSKESLPPGILNVPYPMAYFSEKSGVFAIKQLHFSLDNFQSTQIQVSTVPHIVIQESNSELKRECQSLLNDVSVRISNYPVFKSYDRPGIDFLRSLYTQFWECNKYKLSEQYSNSFGKCHIRAHVVSTILNHLGIDSVKVFKSWDKKDWLGYKPSMGWAYHCAVMVVDNNNDKWVWDPWIWSNSRLLSLQEWVYYQETPVPYKLLISNRAFVSCQVECQLPSLCFEFGVTGRFFTAFQAVINSVVPNPPERGLSSVSPGYNGFNFFKSKPALGQIVCSSSSSQLDPEENNAPEAGIS